MSKLRWVLIAALATLWTTISAPARATATLDAWLSDFACSFTDETGVTRGIPCNGATVTVPLGPGDAVMIAATLNYAYHDDGLALPDPRMAWIQMDANGFSTLHATHEVGWILVFGTRCDSRYCGHPPGLYELGTATFPPILLGLNDVADDLSGQLQVSAGYSVEPAPFLGGAMPTAGLSLATFTHSVAAPIPEPATTALMLFGLVALGIGVRQRR
jgi:Cu/Ag efflux protein CusF